MTRFLAASALAIGLIAAGPETALGQNITQQIRSNEERLDQIRGRRTQLENELRQLRGRVTTIAEELTNITAQRTQTNNLVNEIDRQINQMTARLDTITLDLVLAEDALVEKHAVLNRRLAEIYKRGRLWAFQVLLAAESFSDLLNRYKYLYLVSNQDRALAEEVEELRDRIADRRNESLSVQNALTRRRDDRGEELARFQRLETQRQRRLASARRDQQTTSEQLETLEETERQTLALIERLEDERRAAVARGAAPIVATITPDAIGQLTWPVEGDVVHGFGVTRMPNGTEIQQNGMGISAPIGTPVVAVAGGQVELAEAYLTYGPSIWINHGNGFRTLYLFLSRMDVDVGDVVTAGDQIGLSGGRNSEWGPHIEFQIRQVGIALDPANWLRPRR